MTSRGPLGLAAIGTSLACFLLTSFLGPSVMQPALAGEDGHPPFSLDVHPSPYLVIGLVVAGIVTGTAGIGLCLHAVRHGWRCRPRALMGAGLVAAAAFAVMPPVGSGDHLNYAAYGRMAVLGHDPYTTRAVDLPGDPVIGEVEEWRSTPSVYGPIATAQEAFASWTGGDSMRLTVFVLSLVNALAFALTAWILYRTARSDERRLRAALLWTCNPLLLFHLVAGAHNDVLAIAPMALALAVAGRWAWLAGALVGAGAALKLPAALVGGGPAWVWFKERSYVRLAALGAGAAIVAGTAFVSAGSHAFDQVKRASNSVSWATPWHLLDPLTHRNVIKIGFLLLMVALVVLLVRALPREPAEDELARSRRIAAALVLAWLFAAPYELPWYDGFAWAVLVLIPWSRFDAILLAHTGLLSLGYLPARDPKLIDLPGSLSWLVTVVRPWVIPLALTGVLAALIALCLRRRPVPEHAPPPRAAAGSPG
ncbi:polyprenol phosphomannose-dependent alpha 1,6 mannosyltransferase MptB [Spirillospora sp. CA-294931]|uniref:polyprenol phosphomannose-dependent alpha 1,6 mannosyltransferase MptB n=1 Tax=Spirillospora sp. CA-294931 TaxID=3240042 RepID=UPI003D930DA2